MWSGEYAQGAMGTLRPSRSVPAMPPQTPRESQCGDTRARAHTHTHTHTGTHARAVKSVRDGIPVASCNGSGCLKFPHCWDKAGADTRAHIYVGLQCGGAVVRDIGTM